jgi:hypothetical protein
MKTANDKLSYRFGPAFNTSGPTIFINLSRQCFINICRNKDFVVITRSDGPRTMIRGCTYNSEPLCHGVFTLAMASVLHALNGRGRLIPAIRNIGYVVHENTRVTDIKILRIVLRYGPSAL